MLSDGNYTYYVFGQTRRSRKASSSGRSEQGDYVLFLADPIVDVARTQLIVVDQDKPSITGPSIFSAYSSILCLVPAEEVSKPTFIVRQFVVYQENNSITRATELWDDLAKDRWKPSHD